MSERYLTKRLGDLIKGIESGSLNIDYLLLRGLVELLECKQECESRGELFFQNPEFAGFDQKYCDLLQRIKRGRTKFDTTPYETIYERFFPSDSTDGDVNGSNTRARFYVGDGNPELEKALRAGLGRGRRSRRPSEKPPTRVIV